ncbi:GIY-YIG nuclease family protein [Fibrobacterota bacterium]
MAKQYFVYILTNKSKSTLYIGVTNDLTKRSIEHKFKEETTFPKRYNINRLVYYKETNDIETAIKREERLKKWNREWKERLINDFNPEWKDLAEHLNKSLI